MQLFRNMLTMVMLLLIFMLAPNMKTSLAMFVTAQALLWKYQKDMLDFSLQEALYRRSIFGSQMQLELLTLDIVARSSLNLTKMAKKPTVSETE